MSELQILHTVKRVKSNQYKLRFIYRALKGLLIGFYVEKADKVKKITISHL